MARAPRPDDLFSFRLPTDPRISPDGSTVAFTLQTVAPKRDGYRHAIWLVTTDGTEPARQVSVGHRHDRHPRFSPDGRWLAFLSDRRGAVEEESPAHGSGAAGDSASGREDLVQIHLLPLHGGEARRLTDLPRGVDSFAWSPDGRRMVVSTSSPARAGRTAASSRSATPRAAAASEEADSGPSSDYHFVDRLGYLANGAGFIQFTGFRTSGSPSMSRPVRRVRSQPVLRVSRGRPGRPTGAGSRSRRIGDATTTSSSDPISSWPMSDLGRTTQITAGPMSYFSGVRCGSRTARPLAALGASEFRSGRAVATTSGCSRPTARMPVPPPVGTSPRRSTSCRIPRWAATSSRANRLVWPSLRTAPGRRADRADRWLSNELWRISLNDGRSQRLTNGPHMVSSFDQVAVGPARLGSRTCNPTRRISRTSTCWTSRAAIGRRPPQRFAQQLDPPERRRARRDRGCAARDVLGGGGRPTRSRAGTTRRSRAGRAAAPGPGMGRPERPRRPERPGRPGTPLRRPW